jgi:hypothetical protein
MDRIDRMKEKAEVRMQNAELTFAFCTLPSALLLHPAYPVHPV